MFSNVLHTRQNLLLLSGTLLLVLLAGCAELESETLEGPPIARLIPATLTLEDARVPTIALDAASGRTYVAFFRDDEEGTNVYLAAKEAADSAWGEPVRVNSVSGDANAHGQAPAQVDVGPAGQVYVVWTNAIPVEGRRFPASNLLFSRSLDGGATFSGQKAINTDADGSPASHTFHDMVVAPDGTIYVSWLDSRNRHASEAPVVPANHSGAHADRESGSEVWVAVSEDEGAHFSGGAVVATNTCQCCRTSMAVAQDGTLYLAWRHIFPGGERDMALALSTDRGVSFSEPRRIYADNWKVDGCPHSGPSLALDGDGWLHVAWYTGKENGPGLYYAVSTDRQSFAQPIPLVSGVGVSQAKLAAGSDGRISMAYEDKKAGVVRFAVVSAVGEVTLDESMAIPGGSLPAVAAGPAGWMAAAQSDGQVRIVQRP